MFKYTVKLVNTPPTFEIKSVMTYTDKYDEEKKDEHKESLTKLRNKLEQSIPGSFKVKYNLSSDELVSTLKAETMSEAQSSLYKMEEFVKGAVSALNLK